MFISVRPFSWELSGYEAPVLEGTVITLLCRVQGARPAANITWHNGTAPLHPQPSSNLAVQVGPFVCIVSAYGVKFMTEKGIFEGYIIS